MKLETGIYHHFKKGDLYFAEGLEVDANSNNNELRVRYHALYPGAKLPYSRSLEDFNRMVVNPRTANMIRMFGLVKVLPVEKMQVLLPGSRVKSPYSTEEFVVDSVINDTKIGIIVVVEIAQDSKKFVNFSLDSFLFVYNFEPVRDVASTISE